MVDNNFPILSVSMTAPVPLGLRAGFVSQENSRELKDRQKDWPPV